MAEEKTQQSFEVLVVYWRPNLQISTRLGDFNFDYEMVTKNVAEATKGKIRVENCGSLVKRNKQRRTKMCFCWQWKGCKRLANIGARVRSGETALDSGRPSSGFVRS